MLPCVEAEPLPREVEPPDRVVEGEDDHDRDREHQVDEGEDRERGQRVRANEAGDPGQRARRRPAKRNGLGGGAHPVSFSVPITRV